MGKKVSRQTKIKRGKKTLPAAQKSTSWRAWYSGLSSEQKKIGRAILIIIGILLVPFVILDVWLAGNAVIDQVVGSAIRDEILSKDLLGMELINSYSLGKDRFARRGPQITNIFKRPDGKTNEEIADAIATKAAEFGWLSVEKDFSFSDTRLGAKKEMNKKRLELSVMIRPDDVKVTVEREY